MLLLDRSPRVYRDYPRSSRIRARGAVAVLVRANVTSLASEDRSQDTARSGKVVRGPPARFLVTSLLYRCPSTSDPAPCWTSKLVIVTPNAALREQPRLTFCSGGRSSNPASCASHVSRDDYDFLLDDLRHLYDLFDRDLFLDDLLYLNYLFHLYVFSTTSGSSLEQASIATLAIATIREASRICFMRFSYVTIIDSCPRALPHVAGSATLPSDTWASFDTSRTPFPERANRKIV